MYILNSYVVGGYLQYKYMKILNNVYNEIAPLSFEKYLNKRDDIESKYNVSIINLKYTEDEIHFNEALRWQLSKEKNFNKLWLIQEGIISIMDGI